MFREMLLMVAVGALIGGFTNLLAIVMLFRPYQARTLGRWRIPFTPGLIPKRHEEIALQLGKIVEEYLITEETLKDFLASEEFQKKFREQVRFLLERFVRQNSRSLMELAEALPDEVKSEVQRRMMDGIRDGLKRPIGLLLAIPKPQMEQIFAGLSDRLTEGLAQYLRSVRGRAFFAGLMRNLLQNNHSFLGFIGGIFLQEERLVAALLERIREAVQKPRFRQALAMELAELWDWLSKRTVADLLGERREEEVLEKIGRLLPSGEPFEKWLNQPISAWGNAIEGLVSAWLPLVTQRVVHWLEANVTRIYRSLHLAERVSVRIRSFPLPKLEAMILEVASRELKTITLLGAVLGGLIGLIQFVLMRI